MHTRSQPQSPTAPISGPAPAPRTQPQGGQPLPPHLQTPPIQPYLAQLFSQHDRAPTPPPASQSTPPTVATRRVVLQNLQCTPPPTTVRGTLRTPYVTPRPAERSHVRIWLTLGPRTRLPGPVEPQHVQLAGPRYGKNQIF